MDVIVTVYPEEGNFPAVAKALLEAADSPDQVRYVSYPKAGFQVPESVYDRFAETFDGSSADQEDSPAPPRKRRPGRPRKSLLTPEELEAAIAAGTPKPSKEE